MDDLQTKLKKHATEDSESVEIIESAKLPPAIPEDVQFRLDEYEKKIEHLAKLLTEEESLHRNLVSERDQKIRELEETGKAVSEVMSPTFGSVIPETKSKIKVLEQRIVEMTISLEEKDKTLFELECEVDRMKVELNQMRVEAARVQELEATINELENQMVALDPVVEDIPSAVSLTEPSSEVTQEELLETPESSDTKNFRARIAELEGTVAELDALVLELRREKEELKVTRDEAAEVALMRAKILELEEQLEVSEMNRKILKDNFTIENEEKMKLMVELELFKSKTQILEQVILLPGVSEGAAEETKNEDLAGEQELSADQEASENIEELNPPESSVDEVPLMRLQSGEEVTLEQAVSLVQSQKIQIDALAVEIASLKVAMVDSAKRALSDDLHSSPTDVDEPPSPPAACMGCLFRRKVRVH